MSARPWMIAETNWKQIRDCQYEVAVLPWGATEAHNHHLPYGTDSYQNEFIAATSAGLAWERGATIAVLPNIPFGVQTGQLDIPFCINMNPSTQLLVLHDILTSLRATGVRKFVLLNGHGGNDFRQILRELQARHPTMFLSTVSWFQIDSGAGFFSQPGDHADERETSMMLQLHADLVLPHSEWGDGRVNPSRLRAIREKWAWAQRDWMKATHDTGAGNPTHATAAKGEAYLHRLTSQFSDYLVELAQADLSDLYERETTD
jgi:creatinine amidohydrolase